MSDDYLSRRKPAEGTFQCLRQTYDVRFGIFESHTFRAIGSDEIRIAFLAHCSLSLVVEDVVADPGDVAGCESGYGREAQGRCSSLERMCLRFIVVVPSGLRVSVSSTTHC